jgi:sugar lactone lactonase YvrE
MPLGNHRFIGHLVWLAPMTLTLLAGCMTTQPPSAIGSASPTVSIQGQRPTVIAGTGEKGDSGDGGPAKAAKLSVPMDIAVDSHGGIVIADSGNHRIRRLVESDRIQTVVGTGQDGFSGDGGPATEAMISIPGAVAVDGQGRLTFADTGNHRIRQVDRQGIIRTIAGTGTAGFAGDGGPATAAQLNSPAGLAFDTAGNLYVADERNAVIRKIDTHGVITTVAGRPRPDDSASVTTFGGDGGPATEAVLSLPVDVGVDGQGNLFIVDALNRRIRKVTTSGIISTIAGMGIESYTDAPVLSGPAAQTYLLNPAGIAIAPNGVAYIGVSTSNQVLRLNLDGTVTPIAYTGPSNSYPRTGGPDTPDCCRLDGPYGLALDPSGPLIIADRGHHQIGLIAKP